MHRNAPLHPIAIRRIYWWMFVGFVWFQIEIRFLSTIFSDTPHSHTSPEHALSCRQVIRQVIFVVHFRLIGMPCILFLAEIFLPISLAYCAIKVLFRVLCLSCNIYLLLISFSSQSKHGSLYFQFRITKCNVCAKRLDKIDNLLNYRWIITLLLGREKKRSKWKEWQGAFRPLDTWNG